MPGSDDPVLTEWMFSPTKIMDGKVVLKRIDSNATLKIIKFYNAYCVGMDMRFDGTANASFFKVIIRISPEQIDIGGLSHDNKWPDESPVRQLPDEDRPLATAFINLVTHIIDEEKPKKKKPKKGYQQPTINLPPGKLPDLKVPRPPAPPPVAGPVR